MQDETFISDRLQKQVFGKWLKSTKWESILTKISRLQKPGKCIMHNIIRIFGLSLLYCSTKFREKMYVMQRCHFTWRCLSRRTSATTAENGISTNARNRATIFPCESVQPLFSLFSYNAETYNILRWRAQYFFTVPFNHCRAAADSFRSSLLFLFFPHPPPLLP